MKYLKNSLIIVSALILALTACQHEAEAPAQMLEATSTNTLSFTTQADAMGPATRTTLTDATIDTKVTCVTLAAYSGGLLYGTAYFTSSLSAMQLSLAKGLGYTVYAMVNMGDCSSSFPQNEDEIGNITWNIGSYTGSTGINTRGIPMAGSLDISSTATGTQTIPVQRLLAKVSLSLTCDWPGAKITSVRAYNMNKVLRPFSTSGSAATQSSDILSFQDVTTVSSTSQGPSLETVLYVPENMKGTVSAVTSSAQKRPDGGISAIAANEALLSYLQVNVSGSGVYSGTATYRSYLGNNATSDFNVRRNTHYWWNIIYREDGLQTNNWKIDPDLDDNREISLTNPIYAEPGDSFAWSSVLSSNLDFGSLDYTFSGGNTTAVIGSDLSGHPSPTGSISIRSTAQAGQTSNLTVRPTSNVAAELTKSSQVRVVNKVVEWAGYDETVYGDEGKKVYAVDPGSSVDAPVDYYFMWGSEKTRVPGNGTIEWDYTAAPATGVSSSYVEPASTQTLDKVRYAVATSVYPGDYPVTVSRISPKTGSDQAYIRVNDTRYLRWKDRSAEMTDSNISGYTFTSGSEVHTYVTYGSYYTKSGRTMTSGSANPAFFNFGDITGERKIRGNSVTTNNYADYLVLDYDTEHFSFNRINIDNSESYIRFTTLSDLPSGNYPFRVRFADEQSGSVHEIVSWLHVTDAVGYILRVVPASGTLDPGENLQLSAHLNKVTNGVEDPNDYVDVTSSASWSVYSGTGYGTVSTSGLLTALDNTSDAARTVKVSASCTYENVNYDTYSFGDDSRSCVVTVNSVRKAVSIEPATPSVWPGESVQLTAYLDTYRNGTLESHTASQAQWSLVYASDSQYLDINTSTGLATGVSPYSGTIPVSATVTVGSVQYSTTASSYAHVTVKSPSYQHRFMMEVGDGTYSHAGLTPAVASVDVGGHAYFQIRHYTDEYRDDTQTPYGTTSEVLGRYTGTWSSENTGVATMSYGEVTGVNYGSAGVAWTYTLGSTTYTLNSANGNGGTVSVEGTTHYLEIIANPSNATATAGETIQLTARYHTVSHTTGGESDTSIDVTSSATWIRQSGSSSISVNTGGTVSCQGDITSAQTAVIRASYNNETADETVTFNPNLSYAIVVVPSEVSIVIGEQYELRADIYRVFGTVRESTPVVTDADVTWATEGATTANVIGWTARSTIVGYSAGQVYVTASCTYQGQQVTTASADRCHVTVTDNTTYRLIVTPVASSNPTLEKGYAATYRLYRQAMVGGVDTGAPVLISNSEATWTSSNTAVASFDDAVNHPGRISARTEGTVTVTATLKSTAEYYNSYTINGRTATTTLTVTDVNPEPGVDDSWDEKPEIIL